MYRKQPGACAWSTVRYRVLLRNACFSIVFLVVLYITIPRGNRTQTRISIEHVDLPPHIWEESAAQVRRAFLHAYHGYELYAAPRDELRPLSNTSSNHFNGWGVSAFDSLDTMLIMDLTDEFDRALLVVKQANFSLSEKKHVPYFETIIRYLGGLLSAYALSQNPILLDRADELATRLDPIFETRSGLPLYGVNPENGKTIGPDIGILAEIASLQLEYTYLAKLTGKKEHFSRASNVMQILENADLESTGGMFPIRWNLTSGGPHDTHVSVGAQADSAHEYLLKQYLMTAKTDKASLIMYIRATTHIISNLVYVSPKRHLLYVTDKMNDYKPPSSHTFEHLSCFLPGLLALGVHTLPLDDLDSLGITLDDITGGNASGDSWTNYKVLASYDLKKLHLWAAEGLAQTCWLTYADQPSGLGPDEVIMSTAEEWRISESYLWIDAMKVWKRSGSKGLPPGVDDKDPIIYTEKERLSGRGKGRDYLIRKTGYLLRPETIESLYIMWRITGDPKWRIRGRKIFQAIERETRTASGYTSLRSVETSPAIKDDDMPSYFLAETLKYLYLMFINEDPIPLDKWVFNTEAHPFPVFDWTESERKYFNI